MNYPIWENTFIGGPSMIAVISIFHVYISHLAVGGGLFIWLTDLMGFRENNPDVHTYIRKHTWFFLLLTMVFGGLTGVGIWFIIGLVHPAATSALIHSFVFGWAIEWVFFLGEITALLIYHYKFDVLNRKNRLNMAFFYFLFAWLSLVIINGILAFMLTPGKWLETKGFWDGFFNPTYFPALFFRTFIAVMVAGLFGYVTTVFMKEGKFRTRMMRYCSKWLLYPVIGLIVTGLWYYYTIPEEIRHVTFSLNPDIGLFVNVFLITSVIIFLTGIFLSLKTNPASQKIITFVLVVIGLLWMGGFEYMRETARKPFVINDYMFSTSILKTDINKLNGQGLLANSKWVEVHKVTEGSKMKAGKELFNIQCLSCHTIGGIRNDILKNIEDTPYLGVLAQLTGQGKISKYMPPFVGTTAEKEALAEYITSELNNGDIYKLPEAGPIPEKGETEIPEFNEKNDEYVLLAWNDLGMHCISDCDKWFVILPPANTLEAQLIKRGETPEIITENVEITYAAEQGYENPSAHVDFWEYAETNFGVKLPQNAGLGGLGMSGKFSLNDNGSSFIAEKIPVVPYKDDNTYNPYPLFTIEAKDTKTGAIIASTKVVAPASTEMGCRNCHGGGWRWNAFSGVSDETAANVLKTHDRMNKTSLLKEAQNGNPKICQACHADPALGADGNPELLNLSAAIHGFHANYMPVEGSLSCMLCHPAYPKGNTRCNRSIHSRLEISCVNCHGEIQDHAISLLKAQEGKKGQQVLLDKLIPKTVSTKSGINPRTPWLNEPDCLNCHTDFEKPKEGFTGFNKWTESPGDLFRIRTGEAGVRCEACHNSPHSEYPAVNPYGRYRDVIQPMQYGNMPYPIGSNMSCKVCHKIDMEYPVHHENMYRKVRNIIEY